MFKFKNMYTIMSVIV